MSFQFGGFGTTQQQSTFGTPQTSFGSSNFGSSFKPTGFGQPTAFGSTPASTQQNFSFGTGAVPSFGAPTSTTQNAFGGFGTGTSSLGTQSSLLSKPTFGTSTTAASGSGGFTGFGSSGFGQTTTTGQNAFGGFGSNQSGFGTSGQNIFGGSFNTGSQPNFSFTASKPGFSLGSNQNQSFQLFNQPSQQQQQIVKPTAVDETQAFNQSIFQVNKFGDERDAILSSFNYIQACWGVGKGHYSQTFPPVTYNRNNPFYRFKAVGYSFIFTDSNEDGNVILTINKPQDKIKSGQIELIQSLQNMLAKPNILLKVEATKPIKDEHCMVIINAEDSSTLRRIPATDLTAALSQPMLKLRMDSIGVLNISAKVKPSPEQLKQYLEHAPNGIDPRVWRKAQEDNPDSSSMIPTPLIGLEALRDRQDWQRNETKQHNVRLKMIEDEVTSLSNKVTNALTEIQQMRRTSAQLSHRLLSLIVRQETHRKQGVPLQQTEEALLRKLEELNKELNSPTQFKGRLNELISQIRLQKSANENRLVRYSIDNSALTQIKEFLMIQHQSLKNLVETCKKDSECLKRLKGSVAEMSVK